MRGQEHRNGFEIWRQLVREYEPRAANRNLAVLRNLLNWKFDEAGYEVSWLKFEQAIEEYKKLTHEEFPPKFKVAIVMAGLPDTLRKHLELTIDSEDDYSALRERIQTWIQTQINWGAGDKDGQVSMDVDYVGKGTSKGKAEGRGINLLTKTAKQRAKARSVRPPLTQPSSREHAIIVARLVTRQQTATLQGEQLQTRSLAKDLERASPARAKARVKQK